MTLLWFLILIVLLTVVHELGHFAMARFFDVKVLRMSFGFGPSLLSVRRHDTEYCLSAIALGGYVRLCGEHLDDDVPEADEPHSFRSRPAWQRLCIIFAGPAANLIFPGLIFVAIDGGQVTSAAPIIGSVFPDEPADGADLRPGDRVLAIDGYPVGQWDDVTAMISGRAGSEIKITIERSGSERPMTKYVTPRVHRRVDELGRTHTVGLIGVAHHVRLPQIGVLAADSPAGQAGLRSFDVITSIQGKAVSTLRDLGPLFRSRSGDVVLVTYMRAGRTPFGFAALAELELRTAQIVPAARERAGGGTTYDTGMRPADLFVYSIDAGTPAAALGLRIGDLITGLDGSPISSWEGFAQALSERPGLEHTLSWRSTEAPDVELRRTFRLSRRRTVDEFQSEMVGYAFGAEGARAAVPGPYLSVVRGPLSAVARGVSSTVSSTSTIVRVLFDTVLGRIPPSTLGGPILLFQAARVSAERGIEAFLRMAALVSLNLGLVNLLPVPMLDGGQATFVLAERLRGRPMKPSTARMALWGGLVLLIALMAMASFNDLVRMLRP